MNRLNIKYYFNKMKYSELFNVSIYYTIWLIFAGFLSFLFYLALYTYFRASFFIPLFLFGGIIMYLYAKFAYEYELPENFFARYLPLLSFLSAGMVYVSYAMWLDKIPLRAVYIFDKNFIIYALVLTLAVITGFRFGEKKAGMKYKFSFSPAVFLLIIVNLSIIYSMYFYNNLGETYYLDDTWLEKAELDEMVVHESWTGKDNFFKEIGDVKNGSYRKEDLTADFYKGLSPSEIQSPNLGFTVLRNISIKINEYSDLDYKLLPYINKKIPKDGADALVFFVNAANPAEGITSEQLRKIYSQEIVNWETINGLNMELMPFDSSRTDACIMMENLLFMNKDNFISYREYGGVREIDLLLSEPYFKESDYVNFTNALGYSYKSLLDVREVSDGQADIKYLAIDGVLPTEENIKSGEYPFVR